MTAPLAGRRVLVTRAAHQAGELADRLAALGAEPVVAPAIVIADGDLERLGRELRELAGGGYEAICLTSANGVAAVGRALADLGLAPDAAFAAVGRIACVGPGTRAALAAELGVAADLVPAVSTTAALADQFPPGTGRVLLARADIASPVLPRRLREQGYEPVEVTAYRTVTAPGLAPEVVVALADGRIPLATFASPSTVRGFVELLAGRAWHARVVSIGPVTSAACHQLDIEVAAEATAHDLDGLVAATVRAGGREPAREGRTADGHAGRP